jgi:hypothetical protein
MEYHGISKLCNVPKSHFPPPSESIIYNGGGSWMFTHTRHPFPIFSRIYVPFFFYTRPRCYSMIFHDIPWYSMIFHHHQFPMISRKQQLPLQSTRVHPLDHTVMDSDFHLLLPLLPACDSLSFPRRICEGQVFKKNKKKRWEGVWKVK